MDQTIRKDGLSVALRLWLTLQIMGETRLPVCGATALSECTRAHDTADIDVA